MQMVPRLLTMIQVHIHCPALVMIVSRGTCLQYICSAVRTRHGTNSLLLNSIATFRDEPSGRHSWSIERTRDGDPGLDESLCVIPTSRNAFQGQAERVTEIQCGLFPSSNKYSLMVVRPRIDCGVVSRPAGSVFPDVGGPFLVNWSPPSPKTFSCVHVYNNSRL